MEAPSDGRNSPTSLNSSTALGGSHYTTASSTPLEQEDEEHLPPHLAKKVISIYQACELRDVDALVAHASSEGGFIRDDIRKQAWPILLQCEGEGEGDQDLLNSLDSWDTLPPHPDEDQIQLDVNRSFVYYPRCSEEQLDAKKKDLGRLITQVLRTYPVLCYFQGYHDIVQVLLMVLERKAAAACASISLFRIRDYMLPSLKPSLKHLSIIPAIIEKSDLELWRHLANVQPFFALAATLTLYSHDIEEYSDIARLFDFLLAWEPVVSIYLFAAIIISRRSELLDIPIEDADMLHFTLSKLPHPLDLEGLITRTVQLFHEHPPESLPSGVWKKIPQCSVLKTSRNLSKPKTSEEALALFAQQTRQIRNEERRERAISFLWHHRRTIGSVAVTVLVGIMSIWIRKKGLDGTIWSYMGRLKSAFQARWRV